MGFFKDYNGDSQSNEPNAQNASFYEGTKEKHKFNAAAEDYANQAAEDAAEALQANVDAQSAASRADAAAEQAQNNADAGDAALAYRDEASGFAAAAYADAQRAETAANSVAGSVDAAEAAASAATSASTQAVDAEDNAAKLASHPHGLLIGGDYPSSHSALHHATEAGNAQAAAEAAQTAAEAAQATSEGIATNVATSETNAAASASSAAADAAFTATEIGKIGDSVSTAAASASAAQGYRDQADDWANAPVDTQVAPGKYSGKHYQAKAEAARDLANTHQTAAGTARTAAEAAQAAAEAARDQAETATTGLPPRMDALETSDSAQTGRLDALEANQTGAGGHSERLDTIEATQTGIGGHGERLTAIESNDSAQDTAIGGLDTRLAAAELKGNANANAITALEAEGVALDSRLTTTQNTVNNAHAPKITALEATTGGAGGHGERLNTVEAEQASQGGRLTTNESNITDHGGRLNTVETEQASQDGRINSLETADATQDGRLDSLESGKSDTSHTHTTFGKITFNGADVTAGIKFTAPSLNNFIANGEYALHMFNGSIVGLNSLIFNDTSQAADEGLLFPRNGHTGHADGSNARAAWSAFRVYDDNMFFTPELDASNHIVPHSGAYDDRVGSIQLARKKDIVSIGGSITAGSTHAGSTLQSPYLRTSGNNIEASTDGTGRTLTGTWRALSASSSSSNVRAMALMIRIA